MREFITVLICLLAIGGASFITALTFFGRAWDPPGRTSNDGGLLVGVWIVALFICAARLF